jgi:hypothetical protein
MNKILIQIDSNKVPSSFDSITAFDSGVDHILPYGGIEPKQVRDIVYGAMFTRGGDELKNSALFIGGSDVSVGEEILKEAVESFFGSTRISVMMDSNGCNTTAAAAIRKILSCGDIRGKKATVLGGTGPVGMRAATLLAKEGALVTLTSRVLERAKETCGLIKNRFGLDVTPTSVQSIDDMDNVIREDYAVLSCGASGITMIKETSWKEHPSLSVLADVNAVPPLGIEGIKYHWAGKEVAGKYIFGALVVGGLKMKIHKACLTRLFEQNDLVLDVEEIYNIAKTV